MQPNQGRGNVPETTIVNTDVPLPTVDVVINGQATRINASDYQDGMTLVEGQTAPAIAAAPAAIPPAPVAPPVIPPAVVPGADGTNGTDNNQSNADVVPLADRAIAKHGKQFFVVDKNGKKLDVNGKLDDAAGGFDTEDAARATLVPAAV